MIRALLEVVKVRYASCSQALSCSSWNREVINRTPVLGLCGRHVTVSDEIVAACLNEYAERLRKIVDSRTTLLNLLANCLYGLDRLETRTALLRTLGACRDLWSTPSLGTAMRGDLTGNDRAGVLIIGVKQILLATIDKEFCTTRGTPYRPDVSTLEYVQPRPTLGTV